MTRKKPSRDEIHAEILRHLQSHPPASRKRERDPAPARTRARRPRTAPEAQARPTLMLRRLREQVALASLAQRVELYARAGHAELLVIVGKGRGSPQQQSILGPAVRAWCEAHPQWVAAVREAPAKDGGSGALILDLRRPR